MAVRSATELCNLVANAQLFFSHLNNSLNYYRVMPSGSLQHTPYFQKSGTTHCFSALVAPGDMAYAPY